MKQLYDGANGQERVVFNLRCGHSTPMVVGGEVAFEVRVELIDPSVIRMAKQRLKTWLMIKEFCSLARKPGFDSQHRPGG